MSANILKLYFATNRTKKCVSLTYATDLKCFCTTVQSYTALQVEVQEVDVIRTVLMQINVKAYRTTFVKL